MSSDVIGYICIGLMLLFMVMKMHISVSMILGAFIGLALIIGVDKALHILAMSAFDQSYNYILTTIPLFVLMGEFSFRSGITEELFDAAQKWLGHLPGGLGVATVAGCAGFSAVSGSSVATAATMGTIAVPEMRKHKYDMVFATGIVAAGGTLGNLIPPGIAIIVYGLLAEVSIGKQIIACIVPGAICSLFYMIQVIIRAQLNPKLAPKIAPVPWKERLRSTKGIIGISALFILCIGGIYVGIFTPTEAAGVGAFGAFMIALVRRKLTRENFFAALRDTVRLVAFMVPILIGAQLFNALLAFADVPAKLVDIVTAFSVNRYVVMALIYLLYMILGTAMEGTPMLVLTLPVLLPVIKMLGFDPVWFGVICVIQIEMALISPPVGLIVFVLGSVSPELTTNQIYRGVYPFVLSQLLLLALLLFVPDVAMWLPNLMMK